jgi:hypothetical protein
MIHACFARAPSLALGLLALSSSGAASVSAGQRRAMPDTTWGIHVFNDQTSASNPALIEFTARRYAGTQKQTRAEADALRAIEPGFVILHYRLGMGLGRRATTTNCNPNGDWYYIIDGQWVQEWPGDAVVEDPWIYHHQGLKVRYCPHGWNLMELDNPGFRHWWSTQVMAQMAHNDNDGLFADSFLVPNFLGTQDWFPALPGFDLAFEAAWSAKLESFLSYLRQRFGERYYLIPNIGTWVTTRDHTDYGIADGVFIEYFANDPHNSYGFAGWSAQADRLLDLIERGRIVIGQTYSVHSAQQRMFAVGTYLLLKGDRTYLNLELGMAPEWFPEYDLPIGAPVESAQTVAGLRDPVSGLYRRAFTNGLALVNPTAQTRTIDLGQTLLRAQPTGGGNVPPSGVLPSTWRIDYQAVQQVTLAPGQAAVLVRDPAGGGPHVLDATPFSAGQPAEVVVHGATPGSPQHFFFSRAGAGATPLPALHVVLGLSSPRQGAMVLADGAGTARWPVTVPSAYGGLHLWLQAAQSGSVTNVLQRTVN